MLRKDNVVTYNISKNKVQIGAPMFMSVFRIPARSMNMRLYQISLSNKMALRLAVRDNNALVSIVQAVVADDPQLEKDVMVVGME